MFLVNQLKGNNSVELIEYMPIIIQRLNTMQLILRMDIEASIHKLQNWTSCGARSKIK